MKLLAHIKRIYYFITDIHEKNDCESQEEDKNLKTSGLFADDVICLS
jgi:hypothetical protein